jgi:hypothetical protein
MTEVSLEEPNRNGVTLSGFHAAFVPRRLFSCRPYSDGSGTGLCPRDIFAFSRKDYRTTTHRELPDVRRRNRLTKCSCRRSFRESFCFQHCRSRADVRRTFSFGRLHHQVGVPRRYKTDTFSIRKAHFAIGRVSQPLSGYSSLIRRVRPPFRGKQ